MLLSFHPIIKADINLSVAGKSFLSKKAIEAIKKADAIILPQIAPLFLYEMVIEREKPHFPDQSLRFRWKHKADQLRSFDEWEIPYPKTLIFESFESFLEANPDEISSLGYPFFLKSALEHEGEGIFLVKDEEDLTRIRTDLPAWLLSGPILAQRCVSTHGYVLRVVSLYKLHLAYWKKDDSEIVSISRGARIIRHYRKDLIQKGIEEVTRLKGKARLDLAAVDIVFDMDSSSSPYLLEINFFFGRKGLGGRKGFYKLLLKAVQSWIEEIGLRQNVTLAL